MLHFCLKPCFKWLGKTSLEASIPAASEGNHSGFQNWSSIPKQRCFCYTRSCGSLPCWFVRSSTNLREKDASEQSKVEASTIDFSNIKPGLAADVKFEGCGAYPNLPWVSTTNSNRRTISGVTYGIPNLTNLRRKETKKNEVCKKRKTKVASEDNAYLQVLTIKENAQTELAKDSSTSAATSPNKTRT